MRNKNLLQKLAELEASELPFLSVYLNAEPNENGKRVFDVFLRKQFSEREDNFEVDTPERESFEKSVGQINEFLEGLRASARGAAIFAGGADAFFKAIEFDVPFEENELFVSDKPHLFPLVRLFDQNPMYAVVQADTNAANIFLFGRGRVLDKEEIENVKTNRTEVGGWSQMRYQRHVDNFHQQHAKEVVEELAKLVREVRVENIVLAGDEKVIIPILRAELPKELDEKVIDVLRLNVDTPEHELMEACEQAIHRHDTLQDKEKIDALMEQNYDGGLSVIGVEKTFEALSNGQVQELYLSADFGRIKYNAKKLNEVVEAYAPGDEIEPPNVAEPESVADEMLRLAIHSADKIRFIEDENLLKNAGGVGALLRYTMTSAAQKSNAGG